MPVLQWKLLSFQYNMSQPTDRNFIKMRFFPKQELLVAGDAFRKLIRLFIGNVKRCDSHGNLRRQVQPT